jgi:TPR repeat protein
MRRRAKPRAVALGALALVACHGRGESGESPAPASSARVTTIDVGIGACDDIATCERECDAGSADRCRRLAASYALGNGAARDEARGTELYERACAMNDAPSCVFAGQMHEYAHGVPKDEARGVRFYEKACNLGWQAGCYNLAIMLERGRGVAPDRAKAAALYAGACRAGAQIACAKAQGSEATSTSTSTTRSLE